MNILKEIKQVKDIFVAPKKKYYLGRIIHGTPYFYPRRFNPTIISKSTKPKADNNVSYKKKYSRNNNFKLFGYNISYGYPIYIGSHGLGWKDKFNSPRFEWTPSFYIFFFKWQFMIWWTAPDDNNDDYYEMILWYLKYSDKDIKKAEETWGYVDYKTKESTWNKKYILHSLQELRDKKLNEILK